MEPAEVVAAKRFVLVDEQGDARAELTAQPDGLVGLLVYGKGDSSSAIAVGMDDEGGPTVLVRQQAPGGEEFGAVMLGVDEDGEAVIRIQNADGTTRHFFAYE